MHVVLFKHAAGGKFENKIDGGLPSERRQNCKARARRKLPLNTNDLFKIFASKRLDISTIRRLRIGHDSGRVRVSKHNFKALRLKRLASLRAGVVKLGRLPDNNRAGAENQDF